MKTISEAHGNPQIWKQQMAKHSKGAAAMCKELAGNFRERGLKPFPRLVALDGACLSVALNFAAYKNGISDFLMTRQIVSQ